ncbi:MAG: hypothetical protein ACK4WK_08780 [Anaerolineae bacterium]
MARYGKETRRSPEQVLERTLAFFGPGGLGMTVEAQDECSIRLSGGGGMWSFRPFPASLAGHR